MLRALAQRSKAYWPYDAAFLAAVAPLLVLEPRHVAAQEVHLLEDRSGAHPILLGWHRLTLHGTRAELEDLWVEPAVIGRGHGRTLFEHAVGLARRAGAAWLEWDADPHAQGFYEAMGGTEVGRSPSAVVPGRTLPRMRLELAGRAPVAQSRRSTRPMRPKGGRGSA